MEYFFKIIQILTYFLKLDLKKVKINIMKKENKNN